MADKTINIRVKTVLYYLLAGKINFCLLDSMKVFHEAAANFFYLTLWFVIIVATCGFVCHLVDLFQIHRVAFVPTI